MSITVTSILTMCFLNSILIAAICWLFRKNVVLQRLGPACGIGIMIIVIVRMFVPVEFFYTHSIYIKDVLTPFRRFFEISLLKYPVEITVGQLLLLIWAAGFVYLFIKKIWVYRQFVSCITLLPAEALDSFCERFQLTMIKRADLKDIKVIINEKAASPYLIGLRNPYLILPVMEYGREQLYYIVSHELMHIRNRDIVWKSLIDLLCTVFWWNPIFLYLKKELFHLIEIRNDKRIAAELSEEGKVSYMDCLYNTAMQLSGNDILFGVAFSKSDVKELKQRIQLLASDRKVCRWQQIVFSVCAGVTVFATTMIIFEPYSRDIQEGTIATFENTFLIKSGEQYEVYFEGEYLFTTDDLQPFRDVKIYNNLEEALEDD